MAVRAIASWLGVMVPALVLACAGSAEPKRPAPPARAASSPASAHAVDPSPVAPPSADAGAPPAADDPVTRAAAKLASAWCRAGLGLPDGGGTSPPCDRVRIEIDDRHEDGELESARIQLILETGSRSDLQHLYLRRGEHAASVELAAGWSSGVGAFSHEIRAGRIHVDDVTGDETPEWWAEVELESHDTDAGECRTRGRFEQTLVLCSWRNARIACARLPLTKSRYDEIWADASNPACDKPRVTNVGYAAEVSVSREGVRIEARKKADGRPFTRREVAPARGTLSIAELFRRFPTEVVALDDPLPARAP